MLFISEILTKCRDWHAIRYWDQGEIAMAICDMYPNFSEAHRQIIRKRALATHINSIALSERRDPEEAYSLIDQVY